MKRIKLLLILTFLTITIMKTKSQNETVLLNPFSINITPMKSLLLVNIENDPDSLYIGFEPQMFDDSIHGKGYLIIAWRKDGKVDVYHEPGLKLDSSNFDIAGKGLANMITCEFTNPLLDLNDTAVNVYFKFTDIHNREVVISIAENNPKQKKPFGLLAPMGDALENPTAMPLIMLQDFYFVRRKGSEIMLTIDGKEHKADNLPLPIDRSRMTFIRYSSKPLIVKLNPKYSGKAAVHIIEDNQDVLNFDNYEIGLEWTDGKAYIKSIIRHNEVYPVKITFNESFPNIGNMNKNEKKEGTFSIESHPSIGKIKGNYYIEFSGDDVFVKLVPSKGWIPQKSKLSLSILYRVAKVFKRWPATYEWTAKISKDDNDFYMASSWVRIK